MNGAELIILGGPLAFGVAGLIWARHATRIRRAQKQNTNHASGDESHSDCTLCGMSDGLCVRCGRDPSEEDELPIWEPPPPERYEVSYGYRTPEGQHIEGRYITSSSPSEDDEDHELCIVRAAFMAGYEAGENHTIAWERGGGTEETEESEFRRWLISRDQKERT